MTSGSMMGLLGSSLLIAAAGRLLLQRANLPLKWRASSVALMLLAGWVPAGGLPAAAWVRGAIGDLSLPTLLLLGTSLMSYVLGRRLIEAREQAAWLAMVVAAALFLYPMALGLGSFDPYALGYGSYVLATALLLLTLAAWTARCHYAMLSVVAAVAASLAGLLDSTNLWDYLIDPLLAGYALFWWLRWTARNLHVPAPSASR